MAKRKLPPKDSPEGQEIIRRYLAGDLNLHSELKYSSRGSFTNAMVEIYGVRISEQEVKPQLEKLEIERKPIVELPPVNILDYKSPFKKRKGDEEIAILHASDGHGGKITKSFNKEVYRQRMETMYHSAMTIVNLHRNMYPVRRLLILNTGDNGQGENPYQGSKIGEVEMGARDQIKKIVAPAWNDVLGSFKQHFELVEFEGIPGNHGYERLAPETSKLDLLLYDILEAGIGQERGIKINVHEEWWAIKNVFKWKLFLFHGDGIPCQQGVPFFALDKKLKAWHMQFGGFDYAFGGHFHKRHSDEISSVLEYFMCSTLVSDDDWALKKMGISSNPSQSLYGIHPKHGITWRYPLVVDYKFLPDGENGA
jgi:hypothetical protein